jgi:ABC-type uncharacterized transport system substrate-binding protein
MVVGVLRSVVATSCIIVAWCVPAFAHPHVWAKVKSELMHAPDGAVVAVWHAWTFDKMFSSFATQDIAAKTIGVLTREELQPLAKLNVSSLKEHAYFTNARLDGEATILADPTDYWLEYADAILTLHFVLPFKNPVKARSVDIEVYDPTYSVDLTFADTEPVTLVGAPRGCKLTVVRPRDMSMPETPPRGDAAPANPGLHGVNRLSVSCP